MHAQNNVEEVFPVTPLQAGMLYHDIREPGSSVYLQQYRFALCGSCRPARLFYAWTRACRLFPALRTSFYWEGLSRPLQVVHKHMRHQVTYEDWRRRPSKKQQHQLQEFTDWDRSLGFNLSKAPLIRLALHRLEDEAFHLTVTLHHIVSDGWSLGLLFAAFFRLYSSLEAGARPDHPDSVKSTPSLRPYVTFLEERNVDASMSWWAEHLEGVRLTPLPAPLSSGGEQTTEKTHDGLIKDRIESGYASVLRASSGWEGKAPGCGAPGRLEKTIDSLVSSRLDSMAVTCGVTMNVLFQAAWALTLAASTGRSEVLFVSSVVSRPPQVEDIESTFGPLLNILPVRVNLTPQKTGEWLKAVQSRFFDIMEHGDVPLVGIMELLAEDNGKAGVETMTVFETLPDRQGHDLPFTVDVLESFEKTSYPLTVMGFPESPLRLALIYDGNLYSEHDATGLLDCMLDFLQVMVESVDEPVDQLLVRVSAKHFSGDSVLVGPQAGYPLLDPWRRFRQLVEDDPEAPAAFMPDWDCVISRKELLDQALFMAGLLHEQGVGRGDTVGVRMPPGVEQAAAMLAVWRLGGVWTPLPPVYPADMVERILRDGEVGVVLTLEMFREALEEAYDAACSDATSGDLCIVRADRNASVMLSPTTHSAPASVPSTAPDLALPVEVPVAAHNPAIIFYTSGSTGRPKGVLLSHGAFSNRLSWMWQAFPWQTDERACAKTTAAFVDFLWEVFGALLAGVPLVFPGENASRDPSVLFPLIRDHKVTRLVLTPSLLAAADAMGLVRSCLGGLRLLTCSGEPLPPSLAAKVRDMLPDVRFLNLYGSTEVMADALWHELDGTKTRETPVGRPISGVVVAVVDDNGLPVPRGVQGELIISGACLAEGYHNNAGLTAAHFQPYPALAGTYDGLWYATGDLGRMTPEEVLFCDGRKDRQIKVRGIRIEPEDINGRILEHPSIKASFVSAVPDRAGRKHIVAYVTPNMEVLARDSTASDFVAHWQNLYDTTYKEISAKGDFTRDYHIWVSSYTGERIPDAEMDEAMAETVRAIRDLSPKRLLEIGFGQGFLLFPLREACEAYVGVDNSPEALAKVTQCLGAPGDSAGNRASRAVLHGNVALYEAAADSLPAFDGGPFDTAVYNSVLQYFPDQSYLETSLGQVFDRMGHNGKVYIGDVRNLAQEELMRLSLIMHRQARADKSPELFASDILSRVTLGRETETELLISPDFFRNLSGKFSRVCAVDVMPKRGHADNELTAFRYEVLIHLDRFEGRELRGNTLRWTGGEDALSRLEVALGSAVAAGLDLRVTGIVQRRTSLFERFKDALHEAMTEGDGYKSFTALMERSATYRRHPGLTREDLHDLAERRGYCADVSLAVDGVSLDVCFRPSNSLRILNVTPAGKKTGVTNSPTDNRLLSALRLDIEQWTATRLPEAMLPEIILFSENWPQTASGKTDHKRLPNPFLCRANGAGTPPETATEIALVAIWKEVIGAVDPGREDDFFRLGGNSLSVTQLAFLLRKHFGRDIAFRELYNVPVLKDMAAWLSEGGRDRGTGADAQASPEVDATLADAFSPAALGDPPPLGPGTVILVTGAPGLIGLHILAGILALPGCRVVCLEEPGGPSGPQARTDLLARLDRAGCPPGEHAEKLHMAAGRLGEDRLGLTPEDYAVLCGHVDVVMHSGLLVNLAQSYNHLRRVNVEGSREVIRFCCTGKPKGLHFISSLSVVDYTERGTDDPIREDEDFNSYQGLSSGYILSRWVMERMILRARDRGLATVVYRFTTVSGDRHGRALDPTEMYWRLLRLYCQTGLIPESSRAVDLLPADAAAAVTLATAADPACYGRVFHIRNPEPAPWSCWRDYLIRTGYPVVMLPAAEWVRRLSDLPEDAHDDNARVLLSMLRTDGYDAVHTVPVDMANTLDVMRRVGLEIPVFSYAYFKKLHSSLMDLNWLPAPPSDH